MSASGMTADVRSVAREATARISEEVDYRHEAATIATFSELYRGHPFIRVPELVPEACGDRVLTMSYLDGMDWATAQQADQDLKNTWAEVIMRFSQGNFRHANLLHADPHPGNYRFSRDGTVGFVDFGCVKIVPETKRWLWVSMFRAVIEGRKNDYRHLMLQAGFLTAESDLTADEMYQWMSEILYEFTASPQPATYTPETTARTVRGLFDLRAADHPMARMNVPDDYVFASRVQLALGGVSAGLGATAPARAIADDIDGVAEPITELGKQHHAWVRERGLPSALEHHDHP
jgi:predicted unusual protein kinase regulating ubiquinone biosynthesis (AarF/ABC1/UbiB family)